jgi:hypothetical protein
VLARWGWTAVATPLSIGVRGVKADQVADMGRRETGSFRSFRIGDPVSRVLLVSLFHTRLACGGDDARLR